MKEELEIEIDPTGKVMIHLKGTKGKGCVEKLNQIAALIGKVQETILTEDYYEPTPNLGIKSNHQMRER